MMEEKLPESQHPTVLVVDDNASIREALELMLDLESYNVRTASNGKEALELLERIHPRLVLLDLMMPVMNGWEFLATLKKERPNILEQMPIIIVSAAAEAGRTTQASAFLPKPINLDALKKLLDKFCPKEPGRRVA